MSESILGNTISFKGKEGSPDQSNLYRMQTEGTKKIWNLLASEKVAILADEVGMGKTGKSGAKLPPIPE
jgi:SNF2 family DNA or RNA helicase